ncbi:PPC domain-containing protein [Actinopolymorpha alba]|uniref:PPC domain-containing protein n=1 Tax=Actinopolymorpha alba TaxID=533267 RepID=UPI0003711513|nr:PPC domain-containing protein [Actinopolymorpha alba]
MRRKVITGAAVCAAMLLIPTTAAVGAERTDPRPAEQRRAAELGLQTAPAAKPGEQPRSANPYLAMLPDPSKADYIGWRRILQAESGKRADLMERQRKAANARQPILVEDDEPTDTRGGNDTLTTAQQVDGFGTGRRDNPRARILGTLSPEHVETTSIPPSAEDDGAIPLARVTGISADLPSVRTSGTIGDGPHGSAGDKSGDFDFYRVDAVAGKTLTIDVDPSGSALLPAVGLYDERGTLITAAQDMIGTGGPAHLSYPVDKTGTYYLSVGSMTPWPYSLDPFDSGSGVGVGTEGGYDITITVQKADLDIYAVDLAPGDVLGGTVTGAARQLSVFDPDGVLVQGSTLDVSALFPASSPLPGGGNATVDHVAAVAGTHYVAVGDGAGRYDATVEVYRPGGERTARSQTIFLDFDGARFNNNIFAGAATKPGVRTLSPLRAFLGNWGLSRADEPAVIDAITETVRKNLVDDIAERSSNPRVDVRITNSKDDPDTFGQPGTSRVIVGGTTEEAGIIPVVGIAQSIDPGNFNREETALALLDNLSAPADNPVSLNAYMTDKSDRIAFIGQAIGNIVSHEAGHYLGNWHTSDLSGVTNLMDTGHIYDLFGLGPDRIGGTEDDIDNSFTHDVFEPTQGFSGLENTIDRTGFALTRGRGLTVPRP